MKAFKAFIKPLSHHKEAWKYKFKLIFSVRPDRDAKVKYNKNALLGICWNYFGSYFPGQLSVILFQLNWIHSDHTPGHLWQVGLY